MDTYLFSPVMAYILFWLLTPVTFSKLLVQACVCVCVCGRGGGGFSGHVVCARFVQGLCKTCPTSIDCIS